VRILDEISRRTPPNKAWLVDLTKEDNRLSIKGVAMANAPIALFMSNLEESDFLKGVELGRSSQEVRNELRLKSFSINATAALTKEEQAPAAEQAPNRTGPKIAGVKVKLPALPWKKLAKLKSLISWRSTSERS
jgi:Tfp pilus assembly protein PilN